ncbi:hypothetical protein GYMLUDRAFT_38566 [Collybiopsis luxurians FD-317 M1]|nr:hypothetical protein GYMLUDRAFT_38566 [Collybiopsis luxurians FD-317 M1]
MTTQVNDISAIFDVNQTPYYPVAVIPGNGAGSYFIHRVDGEGYVKVRQRLDIATRGRSTAKAKYMSSRNTNEKG